MNTSYFVMNRFCGKIGFEVIVGKPVRLLSTPPTVPSKNQ